MLNLAVANQQRNDLTTQQVLPPIVEGLTRLKLSMEANISSVPTEKGDKLWAMTKAPRKIAANLY